jgi:hypothetical protein
MSKILVTNDEIAFFFNGMLKFLLNERVWIFSDSEYRVNRSYQYNPSLNPYSLRVYLSIQKIFQFPERA